MSFTTIINVPGKDMSHYRDIASVLGEGIRPDGLLVQLAGETANGLNIVSVWRSRADRDRFEAEKLQPAFTSRSYAPSLGRGNTEFEAKDMYLAESVDTRA